MKNGDSSDGDCHLLSRSSMGLDSESWDPQGL